ncbi:glycosyltransferase family 4 protein [Verrucomicrobiota bacterium]
MKILYLTYGNQSGVIQFLFDALTKKGAEITVVNTAEDLAYRMKNVKFPSLMPHNLLNTALSVLQFKSAWKQFFKRTEFAFGYMSKKAREYLKKEAGKYDMVLQSGVLFSSAFEGMNIPYCLYLDHTFAISRKYEHIPGSPDYSLVSKKWEELERKTYESATHIFTMSNHVRNSLIEDYNIPSVKIEVVGAGPNFTALPDIKDKQYTSKNILFVGKDFKRKGGDTVLKAFRMLRKRDPEANLVIVGPDHEIEEPGVINKKLLDFESMPDIYKDATVFVMPTLREPFGLAFLEAMAYGLPCIGSDVEAVPEIVENGTSGYVVPCGDHMMIAEKIMDLFRNRSLMAQMGQRGYDKVRTYYNWGSVASRMLDRYEAIRGLNLEQDL